MSLTKLERLKKQREELDIAIKNAAKDAVKERRANDRDRKILFGAWCMKHRQDLLKQYVANLTTAREKELFANFEFPAPAENPAPYPDAPKAAHTAPTPTTAPEQKLHATGG
ncbi:hypothetical protein [Massilia oculi]|uniref:hypothetical protein n=1 Tax=Massilia oculi TaxID=945844 RepID=UPI001AAE458E|nr:hypothetical protein [Massilia oculi]